MTRVSRSTLKVGVQLERRERGAPREQAEVVSLHRKDRTAEIKVDGQRRQVPFAKLAAHWRVVA